MLKLKACGFNTVETYVAWNLHEPKENEFNFEGIADVERFIKLAGDIGLHVIVRPSPYICAECMDNTYLPAPIVKKSYGRVVMSEKADLLDHLQQLSEPVKSVCPEPMEKFGQSYGFIVYWTHVSGPHTGDQLHLQDVRGEFTADSLGDTFVRLDGWSKGVVWINGFNLGRYWEQGPQETLYLQTSIS